MADVQLRVLDDPRGNPQALIDVLKQYWGGQDWVNNISPADIQFPELGKGAATVAFVGNHHVVKFLKPTEKWGSAFFNREYTVLRALSDAIAQQGLAASELFGVDVPRVIHPSKEHDFALFVMSKVNGTPLVKTPHYAKDEQLIEKLAGFFVAFDETMARRFDETAKARYPNGRQEPPRMSKLAIEVPISKIPTVLAGISTQLSYARAELTRMKAEGIAQLRYLHYDINAGNILIDPKTRQVGVIDFGELTYHDPHYGLSKIMCSLSQLPGAEGPELAIKLMERINELSVQKGQQPWVDIRRCIALFPLHVADAAERHLGANSIPNTEERAMAEKITAGVNLFFNRFGIGSPDQVLIDSIDTSLQKWQQDRKGRVPGLVVQIRDDNGIVFQKGYGVNDTATGLPMAKNPLFPIASQSKTFTALAVLQLIHDKKVHPGTGRELNLDDIVVDLLPQLRIDWFKHDDGSPITLRDALSHRTRLTGGEAMSLSSAELRALRMEDIEPAEQPGYSNRMYNRLGLIIEDVSGMSFNEYIRKEIVERHNLGDIYPSYNAIPQNMKSYIPAGCTKGGDNEHGLEDGAATAPSGGFFATPAAITNFFRKLGRGEILPEHKIDIDAASGMFEQINKGRGWAGLGVQINSFKEHDNFGNLNQYHVPNVSSHDVGDLFGHTGGLDGYQSETRYNPHTGLTVSIMRTGFSVPNWVGDKGREEDFRRLMEEDVNLAGTHLVMSSVFQAINDAFPDTNPSRSNNSLQSKPSRAVLRK